MLASSARVGTAPMDVPLGPSWDSSIVAVVGRTAVPTASVVALPIGPSWLELLMLSGTPGTGVPSKKWAATVTFMVSPAM